MCQAENNIETEKTNIGIILPMTIGDRIKKRRMELKATDPNFSQSTFAKRIGVEPPTVRDWESGKSSPKRDKVQKIAELLRVDPIWLEFGFENSSPLNKNIKIPLIIWNAIPQIDYDGKLVKIQENEVLDWLPVPSEKMFSKNVYALKIIGDSMEPDYKDGEIIYIAPEEKPVHDDDVIVVFPDGKKTLRRLQITPEGNYLRILNPLYPNPVIPLYGKISGVVLGKFNLKKRNTP